MGVRFSWFATVFASVAAGALLHAMDAPLPWMIGPLLAFALGKPPAQVDTASNKALLHL